MQPVHDNNAYGYLVDCQGQRLTIHTVYDEQSPPEFVDLVFSGVQAHRLEYALMTNILFDVEEVDPESIVDNETELFQKSWKYSWPGIQYDGDLSLLKAKLRAEEIKGFEIQSSLGLTGWVLALSCDTISRDSRASLG